MSSGAYFGLGLVLGVFLTSMFFLGLLSKRKSRAPLLAKEVSAETLEQARELVARGKIVLAVKAVRDETGWDLKRAKAVVDEMPRNRRKDDGFGYYGGPS
jgi:hypothetical protein